VDWRSIRRVDIALAVLAAVVQIGVTARLARHHEHVRALDVYGYLLLAAGPAALLVRRRQPVPVLMLAFATTLGYVLLGYPGGPVWVGLIVAFGTALLTGHRIAAYGSLLAGYLGFLWLPVLTAGEPVPSAWAAGGLAAWLLFLLAGAELIRNRRAFAQASRQRAIEEQRSAHEAAQRQASDERLGIARDLHDVVAHSLSLINVQAGVALELMDQRPEQVRTALTSIKQASREALVDVQSVLDSLRRPGEEVPLAPARRGGTRAPGRGDGPARRRAGHPDGPAPRRGRGRVPDRAGGADQRGAARRRLERTDPGRAGRRCPGDRGRGRRGRTDQGSWPFARRRRRRGQRDPRHDRARRRAGRAAGRRAPAGRRLRGPGPAAAGAGPGAAGAAVIRVLLADDQALVRAGFAALLDAQDGIEVVGQAVDGADAVRLVRELTPDVVLMDIRMPGLDGLQATHEIAGDGRLAGVRVVILTTFELDEYVFEALRAGASGFLVKHTEPAELVRAVRVVASGEALLSPSVTRRLISEFADRAKAPPPATSMDVLTDRERQLVGLVGEGLSNDDIAGRLVLSPATVKTHVNRAMMKLGARDRAHLVVFAYEAGLVRPGWAN
jgi:DNA-binding NarL/FixJ family response regulator